ncbi:hypothetical protein DFH06DRAFT_1324526 [Mycena polygramma]|nr:hypothetical protein DFH06DRAFT_1324526 [Mycena polygramma]
MSSSATAGAALQAASASLSLMSTVAQFAPVPYTAPVISLAESILTMVQRVRGNRVGFQQLGKDIQRLVRVMQKSRLHSSEMKKDLRQLFSLLTEIKNFVEEHSSRNLFHRMVNNGTDASALQDYRDQIEHAQSLFMFKTQINIHENTVRILEFQERRPDARFKPSPMGATSPPPPLCNVDAASSETSPPSAASPPPLSELSPGAVVRTAEFISSSSSSSLHAAVGNFVNCRIGGTVSVTAINGDYTTSMVYK